MRIEGTSRSKQAARALRRSMSPPEIALWAALRGDRTSLRFRRQYAAGPFVLDFYCAKARLAVEVDGGAHNRSDRPARDDARTQWLAVQGLEVLRIAAVDVERDLDAIVRLIVATAVERCQNAPAPAPSVSR
jgi:very-short-patch-repair endonuclease